MHERPWRIPDGRKEAGMGESFECSTLGCVNVKQWTTDYCEVHAKAVLGAKAIEAIESLWAIALEKQAHIAAQDAKIAELEKGIGILCEEGGWLVDLAVKLNGGSLATDSRDRFRAAMQAEGDTE